MYIVQLSAHGNIDHRENPYLKIVAEKFPSANSIEECQQIVCEFIEENNLGAGNWTGGKVFKNGEQVGYISYNGRYWEKGSKYFQ